jgi:competence protein ComGF
MLRKSNGFTMIEMLVSLVIFMMISIFVVQIFIVVHSNVTLKNQLQLKEWEIFSMQLQTELRNSKDQTVVDNKLHLLIDGRIATFEKYQDMVRRQVDGLGHEVMLQQVANFQVKKEGDHIVVQVTDHEGNQFSRKFHPFF